MTHARDHGGWTGRAILHVDMDAFFASVEQLEHPEYRGKPVIVGGEPGARGVVAAASYEARAYGVRSAMPSARAERLCPDAIWVTARHARYGDYSRKIRDIFESVSPSVQMSSVDEAYLDVTPGLVSDEDPVQIARGIQGRVDPMGLSCSIGVASSKTVAKIASDRDKPHGITVVPPGTEDDFLAPLPIELMPGIGHATAERLRAVGIRTLGQLGALDDVTAEQVLGEHGANVTARARGRDDSPVRAERAVKSVSNERTFRTDISEAGELDAALRRLVDRVAARLRAKGLEGRTVTVKLRYSDFTTRTAQRSIDRPTCLESEMADVARRLVRQLWRPGIGVRLLGVGISGFQRAAEQLDLLDTGEPEVDDRARRLAASIDAVRERFGDDAIGRGGRSPRGDER